MITRCGRASGGGQAQPADQRPGEFRPGPQAAAGRVHGGGQRRQRITQRRAGQDGIAEAAAAAEGGQLAGRMAAQLCSQPRTVPAGTPNPAAITR